MIALGDKNTCNRLQASVTAHDRVRNRFYHEAQSCEIILLTFCLFAPLHPPVWQVGSTPRRGVISGLSLLLVLVLAPRGFSPGTPVFPSPQKPTHPNSRFNLGVVPN